MVRRAFAPKCSIALVSLLAFTATVHSQQSRAVEVQMRNVDLRLNSFTVLEIKNLRGEMVPTRPDRPVTFDDPDSFLTRISTAEIAISSQTLSDLLNNYVLAYPGAPLKHVVVKANMGQLKETGIIHKGIDVPFEITGALEPAASGAIRLHADKIRSAHIPVKGLLHLFGEDLSKLINLKQDRGLSVEGDNIILYPGRMLPPPRIEGTVTAVRIQNDRIVLSFGPARAKDLSPPYAATSYIYHRGGVLRFGKLTMDDADLEIVSESHRSPFHFSLPDYNRQLTAGFSKNTVSHGLIVFMRDSSELSKTRVRQGHAP